MVEYARDVFRMNVAIDDKGTTRGQGYRALAQSRGIDVLDLSPAASPYYLPPPEFQKLWDAFSRLSRRRSSGMDVNPIGWPEIAAYSALTGIRMDPWEVQIIERLDDVWFEVQRDARSGRATSRRQQSAGATGHHDPAALP